MRARKAAGRAGEERRNVSGTSGWQRLGNGESL
jgi:hypothetical protein